MTLTTTQPVPPAWIFDDYYPFLPKAPTPVRVTVDGVTLEAGTDDVTRYKTVRCVGGTAHECALDCSGAGLLSLSDGDDVRAQAWGCVRPCPQAFDAPGPLLDALEAACAAVGFGQAAEVRRRVRDLTARLSDRRENAILPMYRVGCTSPLCAGARWRRAGLRVRVVPHWGCAWAPLPGPENRGARAAAVSLAPYHYRDGTPEHAAATMLADAMRLTGRPDPAALHGAVAAMFAEPQHPPVSVCSPTIA